MVFDAFRSSSFGCKNAKRVPLLPSEMETFQKFWANKLRIVWNIENRSIKSIGKITFFVNFLPTLLSSSFIRNLWWDFFKLLLRILFLERVISSSKWRRNKSEKVFRRILPLRSFKNFRLLRYGREQSCSLLILGKTWAGRKVGLLKFGISHRSRLQSATFSDLSELFQSFKVSSSCRYSSIPRSDSFINFLSLSGSDVTLIGYGTQIHVLHEVAQLAQSKLGVSCEVIDLVSILPWDRETVFNSAKKTGRVVVTHEAPLTGGFGAEIAAKIQVKLLSNLPLMSSHNV